MRRQRVPARFFGGVVSDGTRSPAAVAFVGNAAALSLREQARDHAAMRRRLEYFIDRGMSCLSVDASRVTKGEPHATDGSSARLGSSDHGG
jgi:hypothetical protein